MSDRPCVKAMMAASAKFAVGDQQNLLKAQEITSMGGTSQKKELTFKTEDFLKEIILERLGVLPITRFSSHE